MSGVPSDYRKFYPCPNSKKLSPDGGQPEGCLLYTSPSPRDRTRARMPSSA